MLTTKKLSISILVLIVAFMFTGCGSTNKQAAEPTGNSSKPEQTKLTEITISEPVRVLSFAPLYIAVEKGFFKDEGIHVEIVSGGGGTQVMAAIVSGKAQFGVAAPNAALKTSGAGKEVTVLQSLNSALTYEIVVSNKFLEKKGLDPNKPLSLKEKVEALKGATLATDSIGDSGDVFLRNTMELYGQKQDDIKVVNLSGVGAKIGGIKEGVVDGGINSTPFALQAEQQNAGRKWISALDVPEYSNMMWEVLFSTKDYAEKNHDLIVKVVRAIGRGIEFARENPQEAASLIASAYFNGTDPKIVENGLISLKRTFVGHGEMSKEAWDNAQNPLVKFSKLTGLEQAVDTNPDTFWTNKFIQEAFKK